MADEPRFVDVERMNVIQAEVRKTLRPFLENTPPMIVAGALMVITRELYNTYDQATKDMLVEGLIAFLCDVKIEEPATRVIAPAKGFRVN